MKPLIRVCVFVSLDFCLILITMLAAAPDDDAVVVWPAKNKKRAELNSHCKHIYN